MGNASGRRLDSASDVSTAVPKSSLTMPRSLAAMSLIA
jgi:hypothetical protein